VKRPPCRNVSVVSQSRGEGGTIGDREEEGREDEGEDGKWARGVREYGRSSGEGRRLIPEAGALNNMA
jgi:hypothetical protein